MLIGEIDTIGVLAALFPQLSEQEIQFMAGIEDLQAAVENLKSVAGGVAGHLEEIATKLHGHPATNGDAQLESFVGDINTIAAQLKEAAGSEQSAEAGSVLDGSTSSPGEAAPTDGSPQEIPADPNASSSEASSSEASSSDTSGSEASADTAPTPSSDEATIEEPLELTDQVDATVQPAHAADASAGGDEQPAG